MNTKDIAVLSASASAVAQLSAELRAQHELITDLREDIEGYKSSVAMIQSTADQWRKNYDDVRESANDRQTKYIALKVELADIKRLNPDLKLPEEPKF